MITIGPRGRLHSSWVGARRDKEANNPSTFSTVHAYTNIQIKATTTSWTTKSHLMISTILILQVIYLFTQIISQNSAVSYWTWHFTFGERQEKEIEMNQQRTWVLETNYFLMFLKHAIPKYVSSMENFATHFWNSTSRLLFRECPLTSISALPPK